MTSSLDDTLPGQVRLLNVLTKNPSKKHKIELHTRWESYSIGYDLGSNPDIPIILIEKGPKNQAEILKSIKGKSKCVVLWSERNMLILKSPGINHSIIMENDSDYERIIRIVSEHKFNELSGISAGGALIKIIKKIQSSMDDFTNRGIFSTPYMKNRLFDNVDVSQNLKSIHSLIGKDPKTILNSLGWKLPKSNNDVYIINEMVSVVISSQDNLSIQKSNDKIAPSYIAVATLTKSKWVILTNGIVWRVYTKRISASTTNYFEIILNSERDIVTKYLIAVFSRFVFDDKDKRSKIDLYFDEGKELAHELEKDLANTIMYEGTLFLDIVKGVLGHDMRRRYTIDELTQAKNTALKIMYRIWFILYAESRSLLPVHDEKYIPISLRSLRNSLDDHKDDPHDNSCWNALLRLFDCIRNGSTEHNLPQYNGDLFKSVSDIDSASIKNKFIVGALQGLLERNGEPVEYGSLGVRQLGSIYESLLEFSVKQADEDIILLKKGNKLVEVKAGQHCTYSYKKDDLYLASKGGIAQRKSSASYYTPDKIVEFLVERGLRPILEKREKLINNDLKRYKKTHNEKDQKICINRLLDIQILDPSMGSGHFLVEALNKLTVWITDMLEPHPEHPLLEKIQTDRITVIQEQQKKGITVDENLLTDEVLLKRMVMKRCIFGVDLNPMAVDLAKLSLWLDSFAIGMPLTYMDHHIKIGDSTIGVKLDELNDPENRSIDDWIANPRQTKIIDKIWLNTDVTIEQVKNSKRQYEEYVRQIKPYKVAMDVLTLLKMDKTSISQDAQKNIASYLKRIMDTVSGKIKPDDKLKDIIETVNLKSNDYKFFHWELEMADAFNDQKNGFDLIIGNPPWDKVRPNEKEFFNNFDPQYNERTDKEKKKIRNIHDNEYQIYKDRLIKKREFYKNHKGIGENPDYELYRLILERMMLVLSPHGIFSMIVPSAITNSRGATALRKQILKKNILSLYVFENKEKIFPIDSRYKFALLTMSNEGNSDKFPAGFYLQSLDALTNLKKYTINLSIDTVHKLSPKMSIIYETRNIIELNIIQKIHLNHPRLEDIKKWSVDLGRELNMGEQKDKKLLVEHGGWPVLESKNFHQHIWNYSTPQYQADIQKTLKRVTTISKFHGESKAIHENPRLVYRTISRSTDTRTMIASIIPKWVFTTMGTFMAIPYVGTFEINQDYHELNVYLSGIFNSTTFDYIIRPKIDKNVETYHIYDTPVPEDFRSELSKKISYLSAILFLAESWHEDMADTFSINKEDVADMTLDKRIDIITKIDVFTALHYGLSYEEYEYILKTFKFSTDLFSDKELEQHIDYKGLENFERSKHMRMLYGEVYRRAIKHYKNSMKTLKSNPMEVGDCW